MQYYYWQQLNLTYPIDPPSDTGGSDITTHVLQADVGKGSNTLSICSFKCAVTKAAVVGNDPTNVIRFSYLYFVNVKKAIAELYASNILNSVLSKN